MGRVALETVACDHDITTTTTTNKNDNNDDGGEEDQLMNKKKTSVTEFQDRVYVALRTSVPAGKVTTYKALASLVGGSARAIGQAMRRNPYAPVVPCHRVVASDLSVGGFFGNKFAVSNGQVRRKIKMLQEEGIEVDEKTGKLTNSQQIIVSFPKRIIP
eukprot:ANDGO_03668.mRNA.1 Methylated-DNA--protein-cysteine methyltransferase